MNPRSLFIGLPVVLLILLISSCASLAPSGENADDPAAKEFSRIKLSCYDVVVRKSEQDSMVYEKPLDWDLVDFRVRNDEYISLGTAFAINETDLVTAAHVMRIDDVSLVYPERFIRERRRVGQETVETIYQINSIKGFDNKRDYIVFDLKNKRFSDWIEPESGFEFDSTIYTAGNAYGEGLVVREGQLLDLIPERDNGEWNYLKSSIATNPGNSGGPLLNDDFKAIGIVLSKKDDFCYSLPIDEIKYGAASLTNDMTFGFLTFNDKLRSRETFKIDLPADYDQVSNEVYRINEEFYLSSMSKLFAENEQSIFPAGEGSLKALYSFRPSRFPQMMLEDSDDSNWFSTALEFSSSDLGENGQLFWAEAYKDAEVWLMEIRHPDSVTPAEIHHNPRTMMDLILKGINISRKLTNNDPGSRILSYGEPIDTMSHTDRWGREWDINVWLMEYLDRVVYTLSIPTPQGVSLVYMTAPSRSKDLYLFDLKKIADFMNVSFGGTLAEWQEFLHRDTPGFSSLESIRIDRSEDEYVDLATSELNVRFPGGLFPIAEKNLLYLYFDFFLNGSQPVGDVRKIVLDDGEEGENYIIFYRWSEPMEVLPDSMKEQWNSLVIGREHPYNAVPFYEDGRTGVGSLLNQFVADGSTIIDSGYVYSTFIAGRGELSDGTMENLLDEVLSYAKIDHDRQ